LHSKPNIPQLWSLNAGELPASFTIPTIEQLHPSSQARCKQFNSPHRKQLFLLSRHLIKTAINAFTANTISYQQIIEKPLQQPVISALSNDVFFSLSHSKNMILLIIDNAPVGIDIEHRTRRANAKLMATEFMSTNEFASYFEPDDLTGFYRIWCRKEAYFKSLASKQQQQFKFKQLDTTTSHAGHFLEFCLADFQLCSFHQQAISQVNFHHLSNDALSGKMTLLSEKVKLCQTFITIP
jgi:phosphopantetheinyl transferase